MRRSEAARTSSMRSQCPRNETRLAKPDSATRERHAGSARPAPATSKSTSQSGVAHSFCQAAHSVSKPFLESKPKEPTKPASGRSAVGRLQFPVRLAAKIDRVHAIRRNVEQFDQIAARAI